MPDMRHLMLLRHAKTENEAPSGRDQDRRLDERGRNDAAMIGTWMGRHPPFADAVMVSPAVRAHQTWEIAWEAMKDHAPTPKVEFVPELYGADPGRLLEVVHTAVANDPKRVMLVGHNPGLHELALALTASGDNLGRKALSENLPTAALAVFEFAGDDWSDVGFRRGRLAVFVSPKLLRQTLGE
jgi:phosphohistidine phosphatase